MKFEWDEAKSAANQIKHGLSFTMARYFPWHRAIVFDRSRPDDSENRYAAVGMLDDRLHTVIFTKRGKVIRIISLRRANKGEEKVYEENS